MARGSPARVLHELIGVERERVTELMAQLQLSAVELEKQREAAAAAGDSLRSAVAAEASAIEEGDEGEGEGSGSGDRPGDPGGGDAAKVLKRWSPVVDVSVLWDRPIGPHPRLHVMYL